MTDAERKKLLVFISHASEDEARGQAVGESPEMPIPTSCVHVRERWFRHYQSLCSVALARQSFRLLPPLPCPHVPQSIRRRLCST